MIQPMFEFFAVLIAFGAGITATISGFGIGSLITPLLSLAYDMRIAIILAAIPHALATALRFGLIYKNLDHRLFLRFGLASAAGGLCGAGIQTVLQEDWLSCTLGVLLLLAGFTGLTKKSWKWRHQTSTFGGFLSGIFGGLVGNQGGIRAAALLNLDLEKKTFVAVSTASALIVDAARLPLYLYSGSSEIAAEWRLIILLCASAAAGTFAGMALLKKINDTHFKKTISFLLLALGIFILAKTALL